MEKWHVEEDSDDTPHILGPNGERIAEITSDWPEPARKYAALIAAAPELYRALKRITREAASDSPHMWRQVHAALAKAEGAKNE